MIKIKIKSKRADGLEETKRHTVQCTWIQSIDV